MVLTTIIMSPLYLVLKILEYILAICLPCFCISSSSFVVYYFFLKDKLYPDDKNPDK